tara:strand:- start:37 stop:576 length:540 start_codon:yes stop_codon:yes gene_type:complete
VLDCSQGFAKIPVFSNERNERENLMLKEYTITSSRGMILEGVEFAEEADLLQFAEALANQWRETVTVFEADDMDEALHYVEETDPIEGKPSMVLHRMRCQCQVPATGTGAGKFRGPTDTEICMMLSTHLLKHFLAADFSSETRMSAALQFAGWEKDEEPMALLQRQAAHWELIGRHEDE